MELIKKILMIPVRITSVILLGVTLIAFSPVYAIAAIVEPFNKKIAEQIIKVFKKPVEWAIEFAEYAKVEFL